MQIASRFYKRFGEGTFQAASQVEFSSMTQETDESLKQWADRVIEIAHRAFGARVRLCLSMSQCVV